MTRVMKVLLVFTMFALVASAWADSPKGVVMANDVGPNAGPVNYPPVDDPWDMIFYTDAGTTTDDTHLLGVHHVGDYFYCTGGNSGSDPNYVYMLNNDGSLYMSFEQWSSAGWGWRDLAYDGTYLYGSDDTVVDAFELDGTAAPAMNINGPISPCRALAYDPITDSFWTQSFGGPLYNFARDGSILWTGTSGVTAAYGAAFDEFSSDGPWLWIHDQTNLVVHQYDPIGHSLTGFSYTVPEPPGWSGGIAGGMSLTSDFDPSLHCLVGMAQGSPTDYLFVLELTVAADPDAPAAPENFMVANNGPDLIASLSWDNPTLNVGGTALAEITDVVVERDGIVVANLGASTPGLAMTYDDAVPAAGMYMYTVYCVNSYGNGIPVSDSEPIGLDVPAGVGNLVGAGIGTGLEAELNWDNPVMGFNGGYFPPGSIDSYTINRYGPDPDTFTLTGLASYYYDNTMTTNGFYEYGVIPENATGPGPEVISNTFFVGPPEYEEIPYDWIEINPNDPAHVFTGINTMVTGDDQTLGPFNIGFTFPFYDDVTQIWVCSNGWATFTSTTNAAYSNAAIPSTNTPNNLLCPFWDDMNPSQGGSIWYYSDLAGGRFILEYYDVPHYSTGGNYRFEAILYDDGTMDYMYADLTPGTALSATVGCENSTGTLGVQTTYNGSGPLEPVANMGIRIYPVEDPTTPVELSAFNAAVVDNGVLLTWETASELDCYEWAVQRNGVDVATLPGHGTTVEPQSYSYLDEVGAGTYTYRLKETDIGGAVTYSDLLTVTVGAMVNEYALNTNYPNPFNPSTMISFAIPEAGKVTLSVYDVSGRLVGTLVDGWYEVGVHEAVFDGTGLASGVYIYEMSAGSFNATGKMVLMK